MIPQYPQTYNNQNQLIQQMLGNTSYGQQTITRVNGKPGADAFQMGPNSEVLLLDTTAPIVWLAQTDGAGYKTLTPYDISLHVEVKQEDVLKGLEERIGKLEERINGESNIADVKQRKSEHNVTSISSDDER